MSSELVKQNKPVIGGAKFGLQKRIAEAGIQRAANYDTFPNRLGLVFDDSGSMHDSMEQAHLAVDTFIKNCNSADTAIALYPLNKEAKSLTNNFATVGLYAATITATGGTPLYTVLQKLLESENISRAIAFSDGSPTDKSNYGFEDECSADNHQKTINLYTAKKIAIDTIFIGTKDSSGYTTMQSIALATGGIFLHFTDVSVLAKSLKYLTPAYRYMLENAETK